MLMFERIKQLRKSEKINLTQEEFAKRINISRANLGSIEIGRTGITDRVITDICREFNVSEQWLRTGKGEMFNEYYEEGELEYLVAALDAKEDEFKINFIKFMLKQPEERWDMFERMILEYNEFFKKK